MTHDELFFCSWSFDIRQKKMTEQKCTKKRISPPNAAIPLVNPYLEPPVSVRFEPPPAYLTQVRHEGK